MTRQGGDELSEELLGARVEPVDVLDDEHDRRRPARAQEDVAQTQRASFTGLGPERRLRNSGGAEHAEEMGEQRQRLFVPAIEVRVERARRPACGERPRRHGLRQIAGSAAELQDRAVRNRAAVRDARGLELEDVVPSRSSRNS